MEKKSWEIGSPPHLFRPMLDAEKLLKLICLGPIANHPASLDFRSTAFGVIPTAMMALHWLAKRAYRLRQHVLGKKLTEITGMQPTMFCSSPFPVTRRCQGKRRTGRRRALVNSRLASSILGRSLSGAFTEKWS